MKINYYFDRFSFYNSNYTFKWTNLGYSMSKENQDINLSDSVVDGSIVSSINNQNKIDNISLNLNDSVIIGDVTQIINSDEQVSHLINTKAIPNLHNRIVNSINKKDWDEADFCIREIEKIDPKMVTWQKDNQDNNALIKEWISLIRGQLELQLIEDENVSTFYKGIELLTRILSNYNHDEFSAAIFLIDLYKLKLNYHLNNSTSMYISGFDSAKKEFDEAHLCLRKFFTDDIINHGGSDIRKIKISQLDEKCNEFKHIVKHSIRKQSVFVTIFNFIFLFSLFTFISVVTSNEALTAGTFCSLFFFSFLFIATQFVKFREARRNVDSGKKLVQRINSIQSKLFLE